jgi:putative phosphoribosyl transferase
MYGRTKVFRNRKEAGQLLAEYFLEHAPPGNVIVLGLPRGGVPVAYEVASALQAPLDVLVVRKLGAPYNPELAVGAIGPNGVIVLNHRVIEMLNIGDEQIEEIRAREQAVLEARQKAFRHSAAPLDVADKTVLLVDDGIATGSTMFAAVRALRALGAESIVVAVPTSSVDAVSELKRMGVDVVALSTPEPYVAVGAWYEHFDQTTDEEVVELLERAAAGR